jgi:hypothetical protein
MKIKNRDIIHSSFSSSVIKNINPFWLSLLVTACSILVYFLFVGPPMWGTNDDVAMSMVAAGVWFSSHPSPDLFFIHPIYGLTISSLYNWISGVPWYGLSFISIISLSLVLLDYSLLRLRREFGFSIIVIFATIATALPSLWHLQFTIVAGLATLSGFMLIISVFTSRPIEKHSEIICILISLLMLLIGYLIRSQSMLMVCLLIAPCASILFLKPLLLNQISESRKSYILKLLIILTIIFVTVLGMEQYQKDYYKSSDEWSKWFVLNKVKSEFIDFGKIKYNEQTSNIFNSVNWNIDDYNMIMTWQYIDPKYYPPEKFVYVANSVKKQNGNIIEANILSNTLEDWKVYFKRIIDDVNLFTRHSSSLSILLAIALLATYRNKWNYLCIGLIFISTITVATYLYIEFNKAPFRVLLLIHICALWMILLIATKPKESRIKNIKAWKNYSKNGITIFFVLFLIMSFVNDFRYAQNLAKVGIDNQNMLENRIKMWNYNLPQNSIIYNIGDAFPYEYNLPLKSFTYLQSIKIFVAAGSFNQSPLQNKIINSLDLSDDFYLSLAQKKNVYVVKQYMSKEMDEQIGVNTLRNYYKNKYGLQLLLEEQSNLPFLYRMIFQIQNK